MMVYGGSSMKDETNEKWLDAYIDKKIAQKPLMYTIPLAFVDLLGGKLYGKTRMQKMIFFFEEKATEEGIWFSEDSYNHKPYHHGPFSLQLCNIIDNLVTKGYLTSEVEGTTNGRVIYIYTLTEKGKKFLAEQRAKSDFPVYEDIVKEVVDRYGRMGLQCLVEIAHRVMDKNSYLY